MILDTSAVMSILNDESDARIFAEAIFSAESIKMSAATFFECSMVVDGKRSTELSWSFDDFMQQAEVEIIPLSISQAHLARTAFRAYGRGSGSPARLNFGDCFAYALAAETGEPLLFKGNDFVHTDIRDGLRERS
jgi:ribonuclease VapC